MNVQATTTNKVNEITSITNSVGTAWATPTYDGAGNIIGMANPPATTTGTTPAWMPMTEAQWNTLTEAQWNTFTENTGRPTARGEKTSAILGPGRNLGASRPSQGAILGPNLGAPILGPAVRRKMGRHFA